MGKGELVFWGEMMGGLKEDSRAPPRLLTSPQAFTARDSCLMGVLIGPNWSRNAQIWFVVTSYGMAA